MSSCIHNSVAVAGICECMATRHEFLTSCKSCGWIACERYNQSTCSKCNAVLVPPMTASDALDMGYDEATVNAYRMLDKLLQFDRENAQRTHVHDAQEDHYETGTWLTEEEKEDIDRREAMRLEAKKHRAQRKMNIHFDIAGRRVVDFAAKEDAADAAVGGRSNVICSPFADNDGDRPAWMHDGDQGQYQCEAGPYAQAARRQQEEQADAAALQDVDSPSGEETSVSMGLPVYENVELERNRGRAAEVYRSMKKRLYCTERTPALHCVLYCIAIVSTGGRLQQQQRRPPAARIRSSLISVHVPAVT